MRFISKEFARIQSPYLASRARIFEQSLPACLGGTSAIATVVSLAKAG